MFKYFIVAVLLAVASTKEPGKVKELGDDIFYVGVNDHKVDLFEGQYPVKNGIAYNSYIIKDKKTAVIDTVDYDFKDEWLANIKATIGDTQPDYLIVHHMEPDHAGSIATFAEVYPKTVIVSKGLSFIMMKNYFGSDYSDRRKEVKEGDTLELGKHTLAFVEAPMVHWPEVIVSYDTASKTLFSADGFGKFGALDVDEPWDDESRRYFIGIVGKFGEPVQALLKKAGGLDIKRICATHGPILTENLGHYISLYDKWSSYTPEEEGIVIAYTSVYGHTEEAVKLLESKLLKKGKKVVVHDLARVHVSYPVADAYRYTKLVLATTTYNTGIFPPMKSFINHLVDRKFQKRTVSFIQNGSWAPSATKVMKKMLAECENLTYTKASVTIKGGLNKQSEKEIDALVEELSK